MKSSLENWKNILKFIWNHKKILDSQSNLEQKKNAGKITVADFKLYYRAMVIKTIRYLDKTKHVDQWNKKEDPNVSRHSYSQLFDKYTKYTGEKTASSTNGAGKQDIHIFYNYNYIESIQLYHHYNHIIFPAQIIPNGPKTFI